MMWAMMVCATRVLVHDRTVQLEFTTRRKLATLRLGASALS